jgi:hypothetical protein
MGADAASAAPLADVAALALTRRIGRCTGTPIAACAGREAHSGIALIHVLEINHRYAFTTQTGNGLLVNVMRFTGSVTTGPEPLAARDYSAQSRCPRQGVFGHE